MSRYDHVVNTTLEDRLVIDQEFGLNPEGPWLFRLKHFIRLHEKIRDWPSATIVLGPFGDLVNYGNGELYLSWYPVGMRHKTSALRPGFDDTTFEPGVHEALPRAILDALSEIVPQLAEISPDLIRSATVHGGIIFARGHSDIDDVKSGLHERSAIGPRSHDNYHTVDSGKLTTVPLFALQVADRIAPRRTLVRGGGLSTEMAV